MIKYRFFPALSGVLCSLIVATGCSLKNDESLLVHEEDVDRTCSELHQEFEVADLLSKDSVAPRKRWIMRLMDDKDCRIPKQSETRFKFYLSVSG